MNIAWLLLPLTVSAEPAKEMELLKLFRTELVAITPGKGPFPASFVMGSDEQEDTRPAHRVTFAHSFHVAKYEVPQDLWEAVMGANPSRWTGPRNSVEMVSFDDSVAFCRKLTEKLRAAGLIEPDEEIRLPSEAEWEYVARAGTDTTYSFGDAEADLDDYAWHTGNAAGNDPPVGAKKPNPWGLYDIHGYLWEWCLDTGAVDYKSAPADGSPQTGGDKEQRVLRGGSWKDRAPALASRARSARFRHRNAEGQDVTLSFRGGVDKSLRDDAVGLRCVLAKTPPRP